MTEAQIQLQNALTTTFLANLVFLSEYDKKLYDRIDELSRMIENGTYEEKYYLEFIMEDGDFDIYDVVNEKYLYNRKPKKKNEELIKKVDFDLKQSIFELQPYFTIKDKYKVDYEKRFELEKLSDLNHLTLMDAQDYTEITKEYLEKRDQKKFKKINKFIFLGTLLGRHIPKIAEKIDASSYLILERNLEIFRLSLFTVDYTILGKKGAIFSIMDDVLIEEGKVYDFLNIYRTDNYLLKLSITNININRYIDTILNMLNTMNPTAYDYNRRVYIHTNRTTKRVQDKYKFLDFSKIKKSNYFKEISILYIAAGPSLDENIDWIKQNQDKFFIVCIGRALKKLIDNNIKVHIVVTVDEQEFLEKTQFDDETIEKMPKDTTLFASSITNTNVLDKFDKKNIFLFEVFYPFFQGNISYSGFSVGEIGLDILLKFNPKDIFIIGLDLAVNQKTGDTHSSGDKTGTTKINLDEKQDRSEFRIRSSLVKVKGNFKKEVYTTPLFYGSIKMVEDKLRIKSNSTKIYNLSENGAKFEGTISKKIDKINLSNHKKIFLSMNNNDFFSLNSLDALNDSSRDTIKTEVEYIESNLKDILNNIIEKENILYEEFLKELEKLFSELNKNNLLNLSQIINLYCEIYIPYLSYYFNDKQIKAERNKVKKIKDILIKHIKNISEDYKTSLKRVI
ncbi:hypothetical protein CRU94_07085 [Arcobacter sp. AHV-9/2010]|uniref:6-hydroxymethylpterin diphosphokinase MptE-like protein n=1 Tax=Arcobacter sp. AHV-9/2010 TaxID=2021861 RepID=UPI00100A6579|nr:6-hydroxymethylpterin diphosphokinase MptE-like protein [Arcobacter sp. CECT 9299]RXJ95487.1 hypothetical protein CRU94_07085 [Arcobacter sp. CECT 9299]